MERKTNIRVTAKDIERFEAMTRWENALHEQGFRLVAGVDEAGRGPLAGPVVAAACILPEGETFYGLNDSKKMTEKRREVLNDEIRARAVSWSVAMVSEEDIDRINILNATKEAMCEALRGLHPQPDAALIDAVALRGFGFPVTARPKGDANSNVIAAASVLAKVARDAMMTSWDKIYPEYGFAQHKGYGTQAHTDAIIKYGPSPIHRRTFLKNLAGAGTKVHSAGAFATGQRTEQFVAQDLIARGYAIAERRFSVSDIGEIDLIAYRGKNVLMIECKGRGPGSERYGGAEVALQSDQLIRIRRLAELWMEQHAPDPDMIPELLLAAVDLDREGRVLSLKYLPISLS